MMTFETFTEKTVAILAQLSEIAVSVHVQLLTHNLLLSMLSYAVLIFLYPAISVSCSRELNIDAVIEKSTELQPYYLLLNSMICIAMSWLI